MCVSKPSEYLFEVGVVYTGAHRCYLAISGKELIIPDGPENAWRTVKPYVRRGYVCCRGMSTADLCKRWGIDDKHLEGIDPELL